MEATYESINNRWMDIGDVIYTYNGILISLKKPKSCHWDNMDGPRGYYVVK